MRTTGRAYVWGVQLGPLTGVTVLLIDDDLDQLELAERELEGAGARVLAAPSAEAGLRFLEANAIDVVVCDPLMPQPDGGAILAHIRSRKDDKRDVPALAFGPLSPATLIADVERLAHTALARVATP